MPSNTILHPATTDDAATSSREPRSARWLNVVSHLAPKYGGLSAVVPQLCAAVGRTGSISAKLAAFCLPDEKTVLGPGGGFDVTYWPTGRVEWWRHKNLLTEFRHLASEMDGLHVHGLWEQSTHVATITAKSLGKPYIVSAHGMLDPWALRSKGWKKQIYATLREHSNVRGATCLHALTLAEAEDYRRFGARVPIAVIPNAVTSPTSFDERLFFARFPEAEGKRIVLFLGRLHRKKGLDILVDAWASVASAHPEAHLVLAGPDCDNFQCILEHRIRDLGLTRQVLFTGMLDHSLKWSALAAAECFTLPSYSEGLSASVLEAMSAGLPVIVTRECHMPEVSQYKTGWEIQASAAALQIALMECLDSSRSANQKMGAIGRQLFARSYSWPAVSSKMSQLYLWLSGGPTPQSVTILEAT